MFLVRHILIMIVQRKSIVPDLLNLILLAFYTDSMLYYLDIWGVFSLFYCISTRIGWSAIILITDRNVESSPINEYNILVTKV